jgi:hypothetical protein
MWLEGTFGLMFMVVAKYRGWPLVKHWWNLLKLKCKKVIARFI